jgi:hypothetical protein
MIEGICFVADCVRPHGQVDDLASGRLGPHHHRAVLLDFPLVSTAASHDDVDVRSLAAVVGIKVAFLALGACCG